MVTVRLLTIIHIFAYVKIIGKVTTVKISTLVSQARASIMAFVRQMGANLNVCAIMVITEKPVKNRLAIQVLAERANV